MRQRPTTAWRAHVPAQVSQRLRAQSSQQECHALRRTANSADIPEGTVHDSSDQPRLIDLRRRCDSSHFGVRDVESAGRGRSRRGSGRGRRRGAPKRAGRVKWASRVGVGAHRTWRGRDCSPCRCGGAPARSSPAAAADRSGTTGGPDPRRAGRISADRRPCSDRTRPGTAAVDHGVEYHPRHRPGARRVRTRHLRPTVTFHHSRCDPSAPPIVTLQVHHSWRFGRGEVVTPKMTRTYPDVLGCGHGAIDARHAWPDRRVRSMHGLAFPATGPAGICTSSSPRGWALVWVGFVQVLGGCGAPSAREHAREVRDRILCCRPRGTLSAGRHVPRRSGVGIKRIAFTWVNNRRRPHAREPPR